MAEEEIWKKTKLRIIQEGTSELNEDSIIHVVTRKHFLIFSSNSEATVLELQQNIEYVYYL